MYLGGIRKTIVMSAKKYFKKARKQNYLLLTFKNLWLLLHGSVKPTQQEISFWSFWLWGKAFVDSVFPKPKEMLKVAMILLKLLKVVSVTIYHAV